MKKCRLLYMLLALVFLTALSGVQGQQYAIANQTNMPAVGVPSSAVSQSAVAPVLSPGATTGSAFQYGQFYTTPLNPPSTHISAPVQINIAGMTPLDVMFGTQNQAVPYSQFESNPANAGNSYLWIKGINDWTQYAVVPQGSTVQLIAIPPTAGNGVLYFVDSDGQLYQDNNYFFPYGQMTFYADKPGRHILYFIVNGKTSNTVIIDVTGTYTPPSNYMPPSYYPNYYPYYGYSDYGYFPGYYSSVSSGGSFRGDHGGESRGQEHTGQSSGDHVTESYGGDHSASSGNHVESSGGDHSEKGGK